MSHAYINSCDATLLNSVHLQAADTEAVGLEDLIDTLKSNTYIPSRDAAGPFIFSVDHCFSIRGQGTIMTGTALNGSAAVNDVRNFICLFLLPYFWHIKHVVFSKKKKQKKKKQQIDHLTYCAAPSNGIANFESDCLIIWLK